MLGELKTLHYLTATRPHRGCEWCRLFREAERENDNLQSRLAAAMAMVERDLAFHGEELAFKLEEAARGLRLSLKTRSDMKRARKKIDKALELLDNFD